MALGCPAPFVLPVLLYLFPLLPGPGRPAAPGSPPPARDACHLLWYAAPAAEWDAALPVGNGRLGALVFGGTASERLALNEDTLWTGGPYSPPEHSDGPEALPAIRRLVFEGKYLEAQELFTKAMNVEPWGYAAYQPLGDLFLEFPGHGKVEDYRRSLDLDAALAAVEYVKDGVRFRREVFASAADPVLVVRLSADRPGRLTFSARLALRRHDPPRPEERGAVEGIAPDTLVLRGRAAAGRLKAGRIRYEARLEVRSRGGTAAVEGDRVRVTGADAATLLLAAATNFVNFRDTGADPAQRVHAALAAVRDKPYAALLADHLEEHRRLYRRAALRLAATPASRLPTDARLAAYRAGGDPALAALFFNYGRYLLIASSRPGTQPANLQGLWNPETDPPWDCKYTTNVNLEMNYWPVEPGNLAECLEPLVAMVEDWAVTGGDSAKRHYGARGWVQVFNSDLWRVAAPMGGGYFGTWHGAGAWICSHLWEHYRFTLDRPFLARVYPLMKGAARFYLDTLVPHPEHPAWLVTCPSNSPENWYKVGDNPRKWDRKRFDEGTMSTICAGPTCDNQMLRYLFDACIAASKVLGVDGELRAEWKAARDRLPPNRIGRYGQLQEWLEDWDDPEDHHRHFTHLWGAFPGDEITPEDTPDLARAVEVVLRHRGAAGTGFGQAWQIALWARLKKGEEALRLFEHLVRENTCPDLLSRCFRAPQVDGAMGATGGIAEMLLQSHRGAIVLLPALPAAWSSGTVHGWRARGGFVVDFSWKEGKLQRVTVRSLAGAPCRVRRGGRAAAFPTEKDGTYVLGPDLRPRDG